MPVPFNTGFSQVFYKFLNHSTYAFCHYYKSFKLILVNILPV